MSLIIAEAQFVLLSNGSQTALKIMKTSNAIYHECCVKTTLTFLLQVFDRCARNKTAKSLYVNALVSS